MALTSGASGGLTRTASLPDPATGFTITFWVRITGNAPDFDTIWSYDHPTAGFVSIYLNAGSTEIVVDSDTAGVQSIVTPTANTWSFVALTVNGTTATAYTRTDTATALTTITSHTITAPDPATWTETLLHFQGGTFGTVVQIEAFKQYKALLSVAEIWEESQRLRPRRTANIDAYLRLNDASGRDLSGANQNWTVIGTPSVVAVQPRVELGGSRGCRTFRTNYVFAGTPRSEARGRAPRRFFVPFPASTARGRPPKRFVTGYVSAGTAAPLARGRPPRVFRTNYVFAGTPASSARGRPPRVFVVPPPFSRARGRPPRRFATAYVSAGTASSQARGRPPRVFVVAAAAPPGGGPVIARKHGRARFRWRRIGK